MLGMGVFHIASLIAREEAWQAARLLREIHNADDQEKDADNSGGCDKSGGFLHKYVLSVLQKTLIFPQMERQPNLKINLPA